MEKFLYASSLEQSCRATPHRLIGATRQRTAEMGSGIPPSSICKEHIAPYLKPRPPPIAPLPRRFPSLPMPLGGQD
jgi:hypothetical protein